MPGFGAHISWWWVASGLVAFVLLWWLSIVSRRDRKLARRLRRGGKGSGRGDADGDGA